MPKDSSNAAQLAKLLNITVQHCYNLANSGTIPKPIDNQWNLTQCAHAYIKYLQGRSGDESRVFAEERTRKIRLEADILELEKARLKRILIPVEQAEEAWKLLTATFRARMLAIPSTYAPRLVAAENFVVVERLLTEAIHDALAELAGGTADQPESGGDTGASPAQADGQPMGEPTPPPQRGRQRRTRPV